jgi:hypothetical protein
MTALSGVVGDGQGEPERPDDEANQPLGLAQSEMEHGPQRTSSGPPAMNIKLGRPGLSGVRLTRPQSPRL